MNNNKSIISLLKDYTFTISLVAAIVSILFFINVALKLDTKILAVITGILATIIGALLSLFVSSIFKKKLNVKIYISYVNVDRDFAKKLLRDLKSNGFNVLFDEDFLLVGDNIKDKIYNNLSKSDFIILILSQKSLNSKWFQEELNYALEKKKKIFPILKEDIAIPENIKNLKYGDFRENYKEAVQYLTKSLKASVVNK